MAKKLTENAIEKLEASANRREIADGTVSGLYLVLQPSGAKSWAVRFRIDGQSRKLTLGADPGIGLVAARRLAKAAIGEVAGGKDPAGAKKARREAARAATTDRVEHVVDGFITRHAKPKLRSWRPVEQLLQREVVRRWRGKRLSSISPAQVVAMLDDIVDSGRPSTANRTLAALRSVSNWAVRRRIIATSPCQGVSAPAKEVSRERVLSDVELKAVWLAAESVAYPVGEFVKLLVLTGARRSEVARLTWGEIDFETRLWTLPGSRAKNKREHQVPLSPEALDILTKLPRIENRHGYVFTTDSRTAISSFTRAKAEIDAATSPAIAPWVFHDLRRTVATNMQKLGVKLEVTEAVLNHVGGSRDGIVGVYQRHDYAAEKRSALEAWARRLEAIVTGDTGNVVVPLRAASSSP